jgi:cytochrome c-type biogenesis protein CcmH/NrfG
VSSALIVLLSGAALVAACAFWAMRAFRRAGGKASRGPAALVVCAVVGIVAAGAYLAIGNPTLPGASYRQRLAALADRDPSTLTVEEALAVLSEAAREHPRDPLPHFYAGQLLLDQRRPQEAARSFDAALRREPRMAEALMGLGRAIVQSEGRVTPEAIAYFQQAGELTDDPAPWIYQAMAAMEQGDEGGARRFWGEALRRMGPDDPRRAMAQQMSQRN